MMETSFHTLAPGVRLTAVTTDKFKTEVAGVSLLAPLTQETASDYALLPPLLRRGSRSLPDLEAIAARLDALYGGSVEAEVRKKGETQCLGFGASFLDRAFVPGGEDLLRPGLALLSELLFAPRLVDGRFDAAYFAGEKENLLQRIRGVMNDKRAFAQLQLMRRMCSGEPYGIPRRGTEETALALTGEGVYAAYRQLLATGGVALYYCGSRAPAEVKTLMEESFAPFLSADGTRYVPQPAQPRPAPETPRRFSERLAVNQGKLVLGFRMTGRLTEKKTAAAVLVCNALYGGSTNARLFLHVRERLSLCYYASSQTDRLKGVMLVSSGVSFANFEAAEREILAQLDALRHTEPTEEELACARSYVAGGLRALGDSQGRLEDYWLMQQTAGTALPPEEMAEEVEAVTAEAVRQVACGIALDSVYRLTGEEERA